MTDITDIVLLTLLAVATFFAYNGGKLVARAWRFFMGPPPMPRCYRPERPPHAQPLSERIAAAHEKELREHRKAQGVDRV